MAGVATIAVLLVVMAVVSVHWIRVIEARYDTDTVATDQATGPTSDDPSSTVPSSTGTTSPSGSVDTPSQVGETRVGENTDTTLLQVRRVAAPVGREPASGQEWFGIRAEICVQADASASGPVGWSSWLVEDDQGENFRGEEPPWDDFPPQQLVTTGIEAGDCAVGWVLIGVPEGTAKNLAKVVFRPSAPEPAEWAL